MAEIVTIRGLVGHATYAPGSKSERTTATITTDDGTVHVVRAVGANPYQPDDWVEGMRIEATGHLHRDTFLVQQWRPLDVRESPRPRRVAPAEPRPSSPRPRRRSPRSTS